MISACGPIFTPSPRKIGPVSFADSLMSTSPAVHTPGMSSFPRSSPLTLPRKRSAFARAYSAMEPTSVQYPSAAVPVAVLDDRGEVLERPERLLDAAALQRLEDVSEAGLIDDGHHAFRTVDRQRSKTASFAARHDDGLHRAESSSALLRADR